MEEIFDDFKPITEPTERILIYTDGACRGNPGVSGFGAVFYRKGIAIDAIWGFSGIRTNNQSEYLALVKALHYAREQQWPHLVVRADSEMMIKQLNFEYQVKDTKLRKLWWDASKLAQSFETIRFEHVPRGQNRVADALANKGADMHKRGLPVGTTHRYERRRSIRDRFTANSAATSSA